MLSLDLFRVLLIAYLVGSIPFGFLFGKMYGKDVRKEGSGNIGFTNVLRVAGALPASFVLFLDAFKGWISVWYGFTSGGELLAIIGGAAAVLGHLFPVFLGFKGGKGVATGFGICLYLNITITIIALIIFLVVVYFSKYVSLGSISAAITVIICSIFFSIHVYYQLMLIPAAALVIFMHRSNISRIMNGTENKVSRKR